MRRNQKNKISRLSRITGRIAKQTNLIIGAHILNWPWRPRIERRKVRYRITQGTALNYLKRYQPFIESIQVPPQSKDNEPERVFSIWLQGEENAPEIVKSCFRSMRRELRQEVVVLDEKTLFDWIEVPQYIIDKWKKGKMSSAHFCDVCRVELVYRYGGVWLDATNFVTAPIPDSIMEQDFFLFMAGSKIRGSYSFIQNCFFRARKNNEILGVWREAILNYWKYENSVINYFTHHLLFKLAVENNPTAKPLFEKMPRIDQDATHTVWYARKSEPYDREAYREMTADAFFQKTDYKTQESKNPTPGSYAEKIIQWH